MVTAVSVILIPPCVFLVTSNAILFGAPPIPNLVPSNCNPISGFKLFPPVVVTMRLLKGPEAKTHS